MIENWATESSPLSAYVAPPRGYLDWYGSAPGTVGERSHISLGGGAKTKLNVYGILNRNFHVYIYICFLHAGGEVWSSFESMSATLPPSSWGMNSVAASQRNHNVSAIIGAYSGEYYVV